MSIDALVAQYLRSRGYNAAAAALETEVAVKLPDVSDHEPLESILRDRLNFKETDTTGLEDIHHSKANLKSSLPSWHPKRPDVKETLQLGTSSLIIYSTSWNYKSLTLGLFVTNTKQLIIHDLVNDKLLLVSTFAAPLKLVTPVGDDILVCADMTGNISLKRLTITDGEFELHDINTEPVKLHRRLITDFKYTDNYFVSIGWDNKLVIGTINDDKISIVDEVTLQTNPTSILLTKDETGQLVVLVGRLDSSLLQMFTLNNDKLTEVARLSLNDSEFSTHSFQPMAIVQIQQGVITVATDHIPFMRLITLSVPKLSEIESPDDTTVVPILRSLIISNYNSMSPQDRYSNAILLTRPNSSGIWIPGDDGKLRGFDLRTGKVMETLDSNEGRAKSAFITSHEDSEVVACAGAVDRKITIWKCT